MPSLDVEFAWLRLLASCTCGKPAAALAQLGVKRGIVLTSPFFVPTIYAIALSDFVLTIPRKLAKITVGYRALKSSSSPRKLKAFPYFMAWHSRVMGEPAHS